MSAQELRGDNVRPAGLPDDIQQDLATLPNKIASDGRAKTWCCGRGRRSSGTVVYPDKLH